MRTPSFRNLGRLTAAIGMAGGVMAVSAAPAFALPVPTSFTAGDLVVDQVTETSGGPSSAAGSVALVDYSTGGTASGYSVSLPTTTSGSNYALVDSGKAQNDGDIADSADGQYIYVTGYDDSVGTTSITGSTVPRVIGIVSASGTVDTSTALADGTTTAQNFRSAVGPTGGSQSFYNGGGAGVGYTPDGATSNTIITDDSVTGSTHQLLLADAGNANGNLFESTTSNIYQVGGPGLPTSAASPTPVITSPPSSFSANGFAFAALGGGSTINTLYVADSGKNQVEKYAYNNSTGTATAEGSVSVDDPQGLVVSVSGPTATIYITNGTGSNTYATELSSIVDSSGAGETLASTDTVNLLATAGSNSTFKGLVWAPPAPPVQTPEAPWVIALPVLGAGILIGGGVLIRRRHAVA